MLLRRSAVLLEMAVLRLRRLDPVSGAAFRADIVGARRGGWGSCCTEVVAALRGGPNEGAAGSSPSSSAVEVLRVCDAAESGDRCEPRCGGTASDYSILDSSWCVCHWEAVETYSCSRPSSIAVLHVVDDVILEVKLSRLFWQRNHQCTSVRFVPFLSTRELGSKPNG